MTYFEYLFLCASFERMWNGLKIQKIHLKASAMKTRLLTFCLVWIECPKKTLACFLAGLESFVSLFVIDYTFVSILVFCFLFSMFVKNFFLASFSCFVFCICSVFDMYRFYEQ